MVVIEEKLIEAFGIPILTVMIPIPFFEIANFLISSSIIKPTPCSITD